jgi:hypothetical protein
VIRRADHQDAVILAEAIDLVEEEGADTVVDDGVEVFEDEVAGCCGASLGKDLVEAVFGAGEAATIRSASAVCHGWVSVSSAVTYEASVLT